MSKGWIIAAAVFFFLSCLSGAAVMAWLRGPETSAGEASNPASARSDAGRP